MKLYTIFNKDKQQVFSTFVEGKTQFFYKGFDSAEEAKNTTFEWHLNYRTQHSVSNSKGIAKPISLIKAEIEMFLNGEWSKIE